MSTALIKTIIKYLPRYAEEEGDFYSVSRAGLIHALCVENSIDEAVAVNTLDVLESVLNALAVLNQDYLNKNEWCFVSFPAQLMAMSILTAMSENSRFFDTRFWNTHSIDDTKKEDQRRVLSYLESARFNLNKSVKPIRFIYVAWAVIKSDAGILLHQREDKKRFDSGDYGLLGGRLNQVDINGFNAIDLKRLQSNDLSFNQAALMETLKRELKEEAGLIVNRHYNFKLWRRLKPYQKVEGASSNHALTEYYFDVFEIKLNLAGFLFLQKQVESNSDLVWFSIDELVNQSLNARKAFIDALINDYETCDDFKTDLLKLPNSFVSHYQFNKDKYVVILSSNKPILAGSSGKEKQLDLLLSEQQNLLLLGLAAHNRGFVFDSLVDGIILHPQGWLEVENIELKNELIELADLFKHTKFVIENSEDRFFRLSIAPALLFFDDDLFVYKVKHVDLVGVKSKLPIIIERQAFMTALGNVANYTVGFDITLDSADALCQLYEKRFSTDNDEGKLFAERYRKTLHEKLRASELGLKALVHEELGLIRFCGTYQVC